MNLIPANTRTELEAESSAATDLLDALEALPMQTQADLDFAGTMLVDVKAKWKAIESKRVDLKKPTLEAGRKIDEFFTPVLDPLKRAEVILKDKIARYTVDREAERRLALTNGETNPLALVPAEQTKGVSVRETWEFEVTDIDAVPREFMSVDSLKVQAFSYAFPAQEPRPIPGIRFYKVGNVSVRTK